MRIGRLPAILSTSLALFAAAHCQPPAPAPGVILEAFTEYPSMTPVVQLRVNLNSDNGGNFRIQSAVSKALLANPAWDCAAISSYDVEDTTAKRRIPIANIRLEAEGNPNHCKADPAHPLTPQPAVLLILNDRRIAVGDKLTVSLSGVPGAPTSRPQSLSDSKLTLPAAVTFSLTPQAAPGAALNNGAKRTTGQLAASFNHPAIAKSVPGLFLGSANLFSTDERDSKSAFAETVGLKRGLLRRWYLPGSIQQTIQGNQTASNLSTVTTASATSILPLGWTKNALYNSVVKAPNLPELTLNLHYTHRFAQLATKATPLLAVDDFALNPAATFSPIFLLPKLCSNLHTPRPRPGAMLPPPPSVSKQYCLALQTDVGMWYLPLNATKPGSQRAEGYGDVSILIPLSDIPFAATAITNLVTGSPASSQIRVKYSDAVNAANNYARTRQWTFAIEVIK